MECPLGHQLRLRGWSSLPRSGQSRLRYEAGVDCQRDQKADFGAAVGWGLWGGPGQLQQEEVRQRRDDCLDDCLGTDVLPVGRPHDGRKSLVT